MKHTTPDALLSCEMLRFVRDNTPTTEEFSTHIGGQNGQVLHTHLKAGVLVVEANRVRLNRKHLSPDGELFVWGRRVFRLDHDEVNLVRWGPEGPPVFAEEV